MAKEEFNRDRMARWYVQRHLKTDPGIQTILYLPVNAPEREIRLVEVNAAITERGEEPLEPIDFGVDIGGAEGHTLMVLDVTPGQWKKVEKKKLHLPPGWSREGAIEFSRGSK
jgi:hypothetical protein